MSLVRLNGDGSPKNKGDRAERKAIAHTKMFAYQSFQRLAAIALTSAASLLPEFSLCNGWQIQWENRAD